jgi:hypothetical protein
MCGEVSPSAPSSHGTDQGTTNAESFDVMRYPIRMDRDNTTSKCRHETTEPLGFDHGTQFLRCLKCRSVIVTEGGISLAIPPVRTA